MKAYLASSFNLIPKIEELEKILEDEGIEITVKWWKRLELKRRFAPLSPEQFYSEPECEYAYRRDRDGVRSADVLILIADDKPRAYNGANIELGMADAWGKPCLSIGKLENSALYFNVIKCEDVNKLLTRLNDIKMTMELMRNK